MVAAHPARALAARAHSARLRGVACALRTVMGSARGLGFALLVIWPLVLALGVLAMFDVLGAGPQLMVGAWLLGLVAVATTLAAAPRQLRAAEARTHAALDRAVAAETAQRARADELADVLRASEGLVLLGEGRLDFVGILAALTPPGATSYLAGIQNEEIVIDAAHGPLAPWFIGRRTAVGASELTGPALASYSCSGRKVGASMALPDRGDPSAEVSAALAVRFADHSGNVLGWLHLIDPRGERILEPAFVSVAQLVANQIGVATENKALLTRVQNQLTEMTRVQQQLVQVAKLGAVGELAAAVAHEVNNPLTGILGFSELLLAEIPADDPRHQEVAVIQTEAVRARSIVRSLLEFARPKPPARVATEINELVRSSADLVRYRAEEAGIWVAEDYGDLPEVEVDPDGLRQVLLNLLNNAVEAMPRGGELRIATRQVGERIAVTVSDTGVGMDTHTRGRVFSPFFTTRAGSAGGTGLGLSVSLQIVESHGGTIDLVSEPGRGTTFTVWLPAAWPDDRPATDGGEASPAATSRSGEPGVPA